MQLRNGSNGQLVKSTHTVGTDLHYNTLGNRWNCQWTVTVECSLNA